MRKILYLTACMLGLIFFLPSHAQSADDAANTAAADDMSLKAPDSLEPSQESPSGTLSPEQLPAATTKEAAEEPKEQAPQNKIVKAIEIQGNKTISISLILSKIKTHVGDEYIQQVISDDLKRLYNTGYFSDVSVDRQDYEEGFKVIIILVEKPIIEKITFSKLRYFNSRKILLKLQTKEGKFLDNKLLKDDVDTIKEMYSKKGLTTVSVDVDTDIDKTTNKAKLHFVINEGYRVKVARIKFENNKAFTAKRLIKVIKTRTAWLFNSGFLKEDILEEDMERVRSYYEREGFIDCQASYTIEQGAKGRLTIHIAINEGSRYFVGKIDILGNAVATTDEVSKAMKEMKIGKPFSRERLTVDMDNIRSMYFDKGYIFANVSESTLLSPETGKVEITLTVREGGLAYVNKIRIQGNTHTRDIVIRRDLRIHPGEKFDGSKLRRSKDRLRNLGYFEEVSYDIEDTDVPDKKDLVVQVKEAKTGSLSFGGGFSTIDKVIGFIEIEQKNFDFTNWPTFTGGGQDLSVRYEAGSLRNNVYLSFTEPWIFDYPVSGGFDAYRTQRFKDRDIGYAFDEERLGGDLRFGKQFTEFISGSAKYIHEDITIENLDASVSADLAKEAGKNTISETDFGLAFDNRDNIYSPTRGLFLGGYFDVAGGGLGGDKDFYRMQAKASYDIPLVYSSVLELRMRAGTVNAYGDSETVPIFERFFAGGASTIRGYEERSVGPLDSITEDPIGGESLLVGSVEYTVPLIDFIKLAGFFDTGNVWSRVEDFGSGDFKSGVGFGLRVKTPIGPVNLDYGYPLNDQPGQDKRSGKFYFSISRGF